VQDIDPNYQLEQLYAIYAELPKEVKKSTNESKLRALSDFSELKNFKTQFDEFLIKFGHLSESGNDFSKIQWREKPELVMEMITKQEKNNLKKVQVHTESSGDNTHLGFLANLLYRKTKKYMIIRERVNFIYEYGYGLFRPYIFHLAELFSKDGHLEKADDIFFLTYDEVKNIVLSNTFPKMYRQKIIDRKKEFIRGKDIELPDLIIGEEKPPILPSDHTIKQLEGIAVSGGYCSGNAKLVRGIDEFAQVQVGDILIIPHSDISWTPILVKAKAIISESGGMLSHCAIIAREHKIPAVVSVPRALKIPEGARLEVDGYVGKVTLVEKTRNNG